MKEAAHSRISLPQGDDVDWGSISRQLESLYLAEQKTYELAFSERHFPQIEKIFDLMIQRHGLRDVDFLFVVVE